MSIDDRFFFLLTFIVAFQLTNTFPYKKWFRGKHICYSMKLLYTVLVVINLSLRKLIFVRLARYLYR